MKEKTASTGSADWHANYRRLTTENKTYASSAWWWLAQAQKDLPGTYKGSCRVADVPVHGVRVLRLSPVAS